MMTASKDTLDTLGKCSTFLQGKQLLWLHLYFPELETPSGKGSTLKGNNLLPWEQMLSFTSRLYKERLAPSESKFFPFRVDPFQKGDKPIYEVPPLKAYLFPLNYAKRLHI